MTRALGHGSRDKGGAPSTADGHAFAFGNTREALIKKVFGLAARGAPGEPPLDRRTGVGRVEACDGSYADGLRKGRRVHLLVSETTGALSPAVISLLKAMARSAKSVTGYDSTPYGQSRSSPRTFFAHHAAALSCAIVYDGTFALRDWLAAEQRALALGVP